MTGATDEPGRTGLVCVTIAGTRAPLPVLEALSPGHEDLAALLDGLRLRAGVEQVFLLSTCERVELYAFDHDGPDAEALVSALAEARGEPALTVHAAARVLSGRDAARHLVRVASGLESFVLGESDVVGQVRTAAALAREAGTMGLELERLVASAVNTSRRIRGTTSFGESGGSVAATAVEMADTELLGGLVGRSVVVVGGGEVAGQAVDSALRRGADVTVCARTRRHAARLEDAGARVVALELLLDLLPCADVLIFATASPEPLLEAGGVDEVLRHSRHQVLLIDLCVPRNVHPAVRQVAGVRLLDLEDLRTTAVRKDQLTCDVARASEVVEEELARYHHWSARRAAAASVQRLRADLDACVLAQTAAATRGVPEEVRPLVAETIRRSLHQLAHGPTRRLLEAAEAGDERLVQALGGIFSEA